MTYPFAAPLQWGYTYYRCFRYHDRQILFIVWTVGIHVSYTRINSDAIFVQMLFTLLLPVTKVYCPTWNDFFFFFLYNATTLRIHGLTSRRRWFYWQCVRDKSRAKSACYQRADTNRFRRTTQTEWCFYFYFFFCRRGALFFI